MTNNKQGGALHLWGLTDGTRFTWFALVITATFVWFEARYNIDLLNTLSNPNATVESVNSLSQIGKLLASLGISWAVGRALITKVNPPLVGFGAFLAVSVCFYIGLDYTYNRVIAGLKPEVKVEGFNLFTYRRDLLTGKLYDPDIPLPKKDTIAGKILMGAFPILLLDDRFMVPAREIVERKADDKSKGVLGKADQNWPSYYKQMHELDAGHRKFIDGSREAYKYRAFGGIRKFKQRSGGMTPDPNMTRSQFVDMLRTANHPQGESLRHAEAKEIGKRADGTVVYAHDLPYFMDKASYMAWFQQQADEAKAVALPTTQTVDSFRGIHDINSAVFLPPMAIITSLTSALTNLITFALMLISAGMSATHTPAIEKVGQSVVRFAAPIMLAVFWVMLAAMPSHVFKVGTPMHELESKMHLEVGLAGHVWSRLSNIQALILK